MHRVRITEKSIDPSKVISEVLRTDCGAVVVFIGTIREKSMGKTVSQVEIEAYDEMAVKDIVRIIDEAFSKYELGGIIFVHRVGKLEVGDIVVTLAVSAPHRKDAFSAGSEIMDQMKKTTPLWKQEFFEDGSKWVEGESK